MPSDTSVDEEYTFKSNFSYTFTPFAGDANKMVYGYNFSAGTSTGSTVGAGNVQEAYVSYLWIGATPSTAVCLGRLSDLNNKAVSCKIDAVAPNTTIYMWAACSAVAPEDYKASGTGIIGTSFMLYGQQAAVWFPTSYVFKFNNTTLEKVVGGDELLDETKKQTGIMEEQAQTTKNIFEKIVDFFAGFFEGIINAVKGLFVPEDGYFADYFTRMNDFFSEKLGMLYAPIGMFVDILTAIGNASASDPGIPFPGIQWEGAVIIEPQIISLTGIAGDFPGLQEKIYFVTNVIMIGAVLLLLWNKLKGVLTR